MHDFLFQNGNVFDAERGCFDKRDVYVTDGLIFEGKPEDGAKTVILPTLPSLPTKPLASISLSSAFRI